MLRSNMLVKFYIPLISILLLNTGCSSLSKIPIIRGLQPYPQAYELENLNVSVEGVYPEKLETAIETANFQREVYLGASRTQTYVTGLAAASLVGVSAAAIYLGIASNNSRNAITALGLTGAGIFGLNQFFLSPQREALYLAAAKALSCVGDSIKPYHISKNDYIQLKGTPVKNSNGEVTGYENNGALKDLEDNIDNIDTNIADAREKRIGFEKLSLSLNISFSDPLLNKVKEKIKRSTELKTRAISVLSSGRTFLNGVDTAHIIVNSETRSIVDTVNIELQKEKMTLESFRDIVINLPGLADQLTSKPKKEPGKEDAKNGDESIDVTPTDSVTDVTRDTVNKFITAEGSFPTFIAMIDKVKKEGKDEGPSDEEKVKLGNKRNALDDANGKLAEAYDRLGTSSEKVERHIMTYDGQRYTAAKVAAKCEKSIQNAKFSVSPKGNEAEYGNEPILFIIHSEAGKPTVNFVGTPPPEGSEIRIELKENKYEAKVTIVKDDKWKQSTIVFGDKALPNRKEVVIKGK